MTVLLYTRRKSWPLESVTVELSHERVDAEILPDAGGEQGQVEVIRMYTVLKGDLTEDQTARIKAIAGRCLVHRTLSRPPRIIEEMDVMR